MYYIGSPYYHERAAIRAIRYQHVMEFTAMLMNERIPVFSPIVHCHEMAQHHNMPKDHEFWLEYDQHMLMASMGMIVYELDGWSESKGLYNEKVFCRQTGIPIWTFNPAFLHDEFAFRKFVESLPNE